MTVEAWTNSSSTWGQDASGGALEVSSAHASSGSYSLAIPHSNPTGTFAVSAIKVHLCPNGSPLDLRTRSLWVHVLFEPAVGGSLDSSDSDFQYAMWNGANNLGIYSLDNNMPLTPGQWLVRTSMPLVPPPATGMETVTDIEIEFDTFNSPWVGTIYLDEIRIQ